MATDEEKQRWQRELWRQARRRYYEKIRHPRPLKMDERNVQARKWARAWRNRRKEAQSHQS